MPAVVRPLDAAQSQAWCTDHDDGRITDHAKAHAWANKHNADKHPNEERVTGL